MRGISIHASPALKHTFDVRFAPESDRLLRCRELTLWAMNGLPHRRNTARRFSVGAPEVGHRPAHWGVIPSLHCSG